ncbi:sugar 3,4-ketoisomerase [Aquimarina brevivitae]|uniref:WxcM-like protein n=1 Tax=Aquimarina brevivitae TaxID=323412 RepID=A0A4Q7NY60_9FLAO|nr:FdtA/QdtA family cupin domain-containing protein [Aquimarina brevivitae]RZS91888.1 WxcM-like protein [Aquimarina brevivitae]
MLNSRVEDCKIIEIPKVINPEGNIGILENGFLPFETKRVYYLYDVPSDAVRGGHAHKELYQFLIPVSGSFDVMLHDGIQQKRVFLNKPDKGLLIVPGIWRELENFASGSVCLVLASNNYKESDYIRDFDQFLKLQ